MSKSFVKKPIGVDSLAIDITLVRPPDCYVTNVLNKLSRPLASICIEDSARACLITKHFGIAADRLSGRFKFSMSSMLMSTLRNLRDIHTISLCRRIRTLASYIHMYVPNIYMYSGDRFIPHFDAENNSRIN